MVYKPTQTIPGYSNIWNTNKSYNNFHYLIWSTIHGERASQIFNWFLIDYNYTPIGTTDTEMSWTLIPSRNYLYFSNNSYVCSSFGQVVCVTSSAQPGRGFETVDNSLLVYVYFNYNRDAIFRFWKLNMCGPIKFY